MKKKILAMSLFSLFVLSNCTNQESLNDEIIKPESLIQSKKRDCSTDLMSEKLYEEKPELSPNVNPDYRELEEFTKNFSLENSMSARSTNPIYTIPVVVHVVHNDGPENISDAAVISGIEDLNDGMEGLTQNNSFIQPEFVNLKSDIQVEFVLAKIDPQGNPTNGITRHKNRRYTSNGANRNMHAEYNWPRDKYLNIYVVKKVNRNNSSGYAYYPSQVASSENAYYDGIVMASYAFGRHANTYNEWFYVITHEVGHWLNLKHIWGGDTGNGSTDACNDDDDVSDTPNTSGNSLQERTGCGARIISCGSLDNTTNHMDYVTPCQAMFTVGQKTRMTAALNSSVAQRNNLWSAANLSTTLGDGGTGPVAVSDVSLSPSSISVETSSTVSLSANVVPSNADNTSVSWSSNNNSVATVSSNGIVTGVSVGTATITVTTLDGGFTATSIVTVTDSNTGNACDSLTPPSSLSSEKLGNSGKRWRISWSNVLDAQSYELQYRKTGDANWSSVTTTNLSYNLSNLSSRSSYEARVRSICDSNTSAWSTTINFN